MASPSKKANKTIITKVFNDPIHGSIELHPLLIKIIDTPQFQRLRFIKQLGGVYFVYPGASHNRFEHSIGVGYLAGKLAEALRSRQPELNITDRDVLCVQIAGLCHDLGHGPFSHLYDGMFLTDALEKKEKEMRKNGELGEMEKLEKWKHEKGSCDMLDHMLKQKYLKPAILEEDMTEDRRLQESKEQEEQSKLEQVMMEKHKLNPEDVKDIQEMIAEQESKEQEEQSKLEQVMMEKYNLKPEDVKFIKEIIAEQESKEQKEQSELEQVMEKHNLNSDVVKIIQEIIAEGKKGSSDGLNYQLKPIDLEQMMKEEYGHEPEDVKNIKVMIAEQESKEQKEQSKLEQVMMEKYKLNPEDVKNIQEIIAEGKKYETLKDLMRQYGLKPEEDITFIKEMIAGPLQESKEQEGSCDGLNHLLKPIDEVMMEKYKLKPEDVKNIKVMIAEQESKEQKEQSKLEQEMMKKYNLKPEDVKNIQEMIAKGKKWPYKGRPKEKSFLYEIVSNKKNGVDVDKFDYLARDSLYLGIKNTFDFHRFLQFARVCEVDGRKTICTRDIEEDNMYDLFYIRHRLHKRAYQHRVNKVIEHMIAEAFLKADGHIQIEGSGGRMFTLSTAIEDMEAYTKLTDNVFEEILKSSRPELQEAREILQNIVSRKIYKFVGETKPKKTIKDWKSLIPSWKKGLAEEKLNLTPKDFEILVINMDYGMKDKNPVQHMDFYSKKEPDVAKPMSPENAPSIGTENFSEQLIRVFCKKIDEQSVEAARQQFEQWMKPNLDGSEEAMEILQNIVSRKIYKCVGETKPGYPIKDWKSQISGWKKVLAQPLPDEEENNLTSEDFEILVINKDYGMKDENSKNESRIGTEIFSEQLIRVFCKKIDEQSVEAAKKHYDQWLEKEPNLVGPEEARKIPQNIVSFESYKCVGETKPEYPIEDWESRISGWKKVLAQPLPDEEENNLKPEDFEILVINKDYGMKDENSKNAPSIGTTIFSEQLIRVFCKKIDEQSVEAARQHFKQW
ncbi:interaptin isoform X2 [Labrus bergylta]|uniref:interaptin isoform X2 n=1 Tax=Labrus bergylta TaxID=56723 RepID=UPI003313CFA6